MAYCDRCECYFSSERALQRHKEDSARHHLCLDCYRDFTSWNSLRQHYMQSPCHNYCRYCNLDYDSAEDLQDHFESEHGVCSSCDVVFEDDTGLHDHNLEEHWYCESCRRVFQNQSNLNAHLNSSVHQPKNVRCLGAGCGRAFVSLSALMLHFEAGTCPSGMTRKELNRMVVRADRNNLITNPSRLIRGPDGYTPATTIDTWATNRSYNSEYEAYECFLCHRLFSTLKALNAHLQSPKHQDKIYRCPNRTTCGLEFSVLSALTQHVESDKCAVKRFRHVQNALDSLVGGMRKISI